MLPGGSRTYDMHYLGHVSWVGSVRNKSCTTSHTAAGKDLHDLDRNLHVRI